MNIALISLWIALGAVLLTTAMTTSLRAIGAVSGSRRERYRSEIAEQLAAYAVGAATTRPRPLRDDSSNACCTKSSHGWLRT